MKKTALILLTALGSCAMAQSNPCETQRNEAETRLCIGNELRDSDQVINNVYKKAMAATEESQKERLKLEQRQWIRDRTRLCELNGKLTDREAWINDILQSSSKTICTLQMTRSRITFLSRLATPPTAPVPEQPAAQNKPEEPHTEKLAYDGKKSTIHSTGKWYFEFSLRMRDIATIAPTLLIFGISDQEHQTGISLNIPSSTQDNSLIRFGIAVDLDNGKMYARRNGEWWRGRPGSNEGSDIKLGRNYYAIFTAAATEDGKEREMIQKGALVPNFGDAPFAYAIPDGYQPWRNAIK